MTKKILVCKYNDSETDDICECYDDESLLQTRVDQLCVWSNYNMLEYGNNALGAIKELKVYEVLSEQNIDVESEEFLAASRRLVEEVNATQSEKEREKNLKEFYRLKELLKIKD